MGFVLAVEGYGSLGGVEAFFKAGSVAIIGASSTPGKIGYEVVRSLVEGGYKGFIYPINPRAEEVLGLKCYRSILEVPGSVDLAVFTLPPSLIPRVMDECGLKKVKGVIIISGGFKELGPEGERLEGEVVEKARRYGMRVIGPNCIGVFDGRTRLQTFFQSHDRMLRPPAGDIAFLTQSGTFGTVILEWAAEDGLGVSKFVSYGNRCDVDEAELIKYFEADPETKVIAIYMEGLGDGRRFLQASKEVCRKKPIIVLKAGRTEEGSQASKSHTGWMAGNKQVYEAAFKQGGVIAASNLEELFDMAKALTLQPAPKGDRVAMVSNGAGPMVMAVDSLKEKGLKLAELSGEVKEEMRKLFPPFYNVNNPIDLTGSASSKDYDIALRNLVKDLGVDIIIPFFVFQDTPLDEGIIEVMFKASQEGRKLSKPILCCAAGGPYTRRMSRRLEEMKIPVYPTPERVVAAAYALKKHASNLKQA